jgi:hypothetical protein
MTIKVGDEVLVTALSAEDGYLKGTLVSHTEDFTQVVITHETKNYKYEHVIPRVLYITKRQRKVDE